MKSLRLPAGAALALRARVVELKARRGFVSGWSFIWLGIVVAGVGAFLVYYGQDLFSKANAPATTGGINSTGSGNVMNVGGTLVQILPPGPEAGRAGSTTIETTSSAILENPSCENGLAAWGTGFFEAAFPVEGPLRGPLATNGAKAAWRADGRRARAGLLALRVEDTTPSGPNTYSMLSQRIKVKPQTTYEVGFWYFTESTDPEGSFSLRFIPSRSASPDEWERRKIKVRDPKPGEWTPYSAIFNSEGDTYFDVRFFAESPLRAWVNDVFVEEQSGGRQAS
jgi:hypothetical protein